MTRYFRSAFSLVLLACFFVPAAYSQDTSRDSDDSNAPYLIHVISRSTQAVDYRKKGSTRVDFRGTDLMPEITGQAKVEGRTGRLDIDAQVEHVRPASTFGLAYLTYVLWAITPQGGPKNLGEVIIRDGKGSLKVTADLQAFAIIVTAEPYFAVSQPSDLVVAQDVVREDTTGRIETVDVKYDLIPRTLYAAQVSSIPQPIFGVDKKIPLDLLEARNALRIARESHADRYAASTFNKAQADLDKAEEYYRTKQGSSPIGTVAREATQTAEEARVMTLQAEREEHERMVREAARKRAETAEASAEEQRREAETQQAAAAQAQAAAQSASEDRQHAEMDRAAAEQARAAAEQAKQQAEMATAQANQQAEQSEQARQQAEAEKAQMRARLLVQLNAVLQTRDTARGLIVNMPDVLFDTGKADLRSAARERLAKIAGILLAYPDIRVEIDGHTDSTGSLEFNQRLSERRAESVRSYLAQQGVAQAALTTQGFGPSQPIASNDTASGRQQNRRVELIVSGESIGQMAGQQTANPQ